MRLSRFILLSILFAIIVNSCGKKPRSVMSENKMIAVFEDLYLADAIMKTRRDDYKSNADKDALVNSILKKHDITQADLDESLIWYADNISEYSKIQDTISARLQRKSDQFSELTTSDRSKRLSGLGITLPEYYVLDVNNPTFRFKIDSMKLKSFDVDKFKFSYNIRGVDTTFHKIEAAVYFKYKDTTVVDKQTIISDSHYVTIKPQIADSLLKEISGYVHVVMATSDLPKVILENIRNTDIQQPMDTLNSDVEEKLPKEGDKKVRDKIIN